MLRAFAFFVSVSLVTTSLLAQVPRTINVEIRGGDQNHHLLDESGHEIGACSGKCTFDVAPGTYKIVADETADAPAATLVTRIVIPSVVEVTPGSKTQRTGGQVLRIVGGVAVFVGLVGLVGILSDRRRTSACRATAGITNRRAPRRGSSSR